jgi:hypothetical protein
MSLSHIPVNLRCKKFLIFKNQMAFIVMKCVEPMKISFCVKHRVNYCLDCGTGKTVGLVRGASGALVTPQGFAGQTFYINKIL